MSMFGGAMAQAGASAIGGLAGNVLGGALDAIGIGSGARQYNYARKLAEQQFELNEKAAQNAFKRQNELYDKDYNLHTYGMMRNQMENAGLSVGLMYGGGGSAGVGGGSTGAAPQGGSSPSGIGSATELRVNPQEIANANLANENAGLAKAQADYYKSLTTEKNNWNGIFSVMKNIKENENISLDLKNKFQSIINEYQDIISDSQATMSQQQIAELTGKIDKLREDTAKTKRERELLDAMELLVKAQTDTESSKQNYYETGSNYNRARTATENAIREYEIEIKKNKGELISAETELAKRKAKEVDALIDKWGHDNNWTDQQIKASKDARREAWAKFGVDTAETISSEARRWITLGLGN